MFGMHDCPQCKEAVKKREELSSRYHNLLYTKEEYDRARGKGAFKKKFPDSVKLMNDLLDRKTELAVAHAKHRPKMQEEQTAEPSPAADAGIPIE